MRFVFSMTLVMAVACARSEQPINLVDGGTGNILPDAGDAGDPGTPDAGVDAGSDAGQADAGPADAGTADAGQPDAGPADGGVPFGGPGPWPIGNESYGYADSIQEMPVVGVSTDENQNLWVATHAALYLLKPGDKTFHRYDEKDGLHLPNNPVAYCDSSLGGGDRSCPIYGAAAAPGISEITGGGPGEVFVGYYGTHNWNDPNDGTWGDVYRHTGKLDRVRLKSDGTLEVVRFDMVSGNTAMYWHNRTVLRMVYDHLIHPHELYVGTDHGVDKFSPDLWHPTNTTGDTWFDSVGNNQMWMSDHIHPQTCYHTPCGGGETGLRLGDWRGLAIDANGDLWMGGRWAAGHTIWVAPNPEWYDVGRRSQDPNPKVRSLFDAAMGDPWCPAGETPVCDNNGVCSNCTPSSNGWRGNRPIFLTPNEGEVVNISAVTVTTDGTVWFASDPTGSGEPAYGVASYANWQYTYYDPIGGIGLGESNVRDMVALPDGRIVFAGPTTGLVFWDPKTKIGKPLRAGQGIPDDRIYRLELDTMVNPPALHVATAGGAAVLRVLP